MYFMWLIAPIQYPLPLGGAKFRVFSRAAVLRHFFYAVHGRRKDFF